MQKLGGKAVWIISFIPTLEQSCECWKIAFLNNVIFSDPEINLALTCIQKHDMLCAALCCISDSEVAAGSHVLSYIY